MNCANICLRYITKSKQSHIIRRLASTMTNASDRYIYLTLPDKACYFKKVTVAQTETESRKRWSHHLEESLSYLVFPRNIEAPGKQESYVKSALRAYVVYRESSSWEGVNSSHCLQGSRSSNLTEDTWEGLTRGVCIQSDTIQGSEATQNTSSRITELLNNNKDLVAYQLISLSEKSFKLIDLGGEDDVATEDSETYLTPVSGQDVVCDYEKMKASPIFALPYLRPVFHSFKDARYVLSQLIHQPEVRQLLEITDKHVTMDTLKLCDQSLPQPFVVVEGMDATGKTTLTEVLERKLGAVRYFTPPPPITQLRPFFDKFPEIVRRAYYCMGNYIIAGSIIEECQKRPVIMDRYWHSTTAYGIANESSSDDLPDVGHPVYQWPSDLLKPTLVLFLTVSEEIRKQRLSGRGIQATFEEKSLDKDQLFRQRLCTSYRRMREPACVEIDASGTVEEVQTEAVNILKQHGVNL